MVRDGARHGAGGRGEPPAVPGDRGWAAERSDRVPGPVVDAGSGPGVVAALLAEVFPDREVYAVDAEAALLERAADRAHRTGLEGQLHTHRAELPGGLDALPAASLVWAGRSLHHVGDQRAGLAAFGRALLPGGHLVLLEGGLPPRTLPRELGFGRPGIESRLDAAQEEWFAGMRESLPGTVKETEDWTALLEAAGLRHVATRSFLLDLPAPVPYETRANLIAQWQRRLDHVELDPVDRATADRLLDPEDSAACTTGRTSSSSAPRRSTWPDARMSRSRRTGAPHRATAVRGTRAYGERSLSPR
ncbi:class I SAM-dependent methyltransferase [Actinomadura keratinilytica]